MSGTIGEIVRNPWRLTRSSESSEEGDNSWKSIVMNESNMNKLVNTLCRMRGAALKIGQMLSLQDDNVMPPEVTHALNRVRRGRTKFPSSSLSLSACPQLFALN